MMEGKATAEEQAAKSALGGRIRAIRRKFRQRRADESGLTTLEWLLIVAAVAGLAALAVVLVQNVVNDTAEQISGSNARATAAKVAAASVVEESKNANPNDVRFNTWGKWDNYFTDKCNRIRITYSDAGITGMTAEFDYTQGSTTKPTEALLVAAIVGTAVAATPQANCVTIPP